VASVGMDGVVNPCEDEDDDPESVVFLEEEPDPDCLSSLPDDLLSPADFLWPAPDWLSPPCFFLSPEPLAAMRSRWNLLCGYCGTPTWIGAGATCGWYCCGGGGCWYCCGAGCST